MQVLGIIRTWKANSLLAFILARKVVSLQNPPQNFNFFNLMKANPGGEKKQQAVFSQICPDYSALHRNEPISC